MVFTSDPVEKIGASNTISVAGDGAICGSNELSRLERAAGAGGTTTTSVA